MFFSSNDSFEPRRLAKKRRNRRIPTVLPQLEMEKRSSVKTASSIQSLDESGCLRRR